MNEKYVFEKWIERSKSMTMLEAFYFLAEDYPDRSAIKHFVKGKSETISYKSFIFALNNAALILKEKGVGREDRVVLIGENSPVWLFFYFATLLCRATIVPVDPQFSPENIKRIIDATEPSVIICQSGILSDVQIPSKTVLVEIEPYSSKYLEPCEIVKVPDRTGMVQSIIFTSGTTGEPKGVVLTDDNILANVRDIMLTGFLDSESSFLSILPYFHVYSLTASVIMPMFAGIPICMTSLKPDEIRLALKTFNPTHMIAVPRLLRLMTDGIKRKLSDSGFIGSMLLTILNRSIKNEKQQKANPFKCLLLPIKRRFGKRMEYIVSGGAKLEEEVYFALRALGLKVIEGYGLTETSPILALNPMSMQKAGKVGRPIASVEIKLHNVKEGLGEIIARGPNVFKGYFTRPDLTKKAIIDGWFHTGDLGRIDEDGFVSIAGRANEMIVTEGGKNIFPEEVERNFNASKYISDCCLFLRQREGRAAVLSILVVPDMKKLKADAIYDVIGSIKWEVSEISKKLPSYSRPLDVYTCLGELPKTSLGKIRRHMIPGLVSDKRYDAEERPDEPMGKIQALIAKYLKKKYIRQKAHIEIDLGLDSLARLDLHSYLEEELNLNIDLEDASRAETVKDVVEIFSKAGVYRAEEGEKEVKVPKLTWAKLLVQFFCDLIMKSYLKSRINLEFGQIQDLPKRGSFILAPNHVSLLDGIVLRLMLPVQLRRRLIFLSIGKYFDNFFLRPLSWASRIIVIGRKNTPSKAYSILEKTLRKGNPVVIFPEGQRSPDGLLQEIRPGTFRLAVETGSIIYPVLINNLFGFYSRGGKPHKRPVTVNLLEPIDPGELKAKLGKKADVNLEKILTLKWSEAITKAQGNRSATKTQRHKEGI